MFHFVVVDGLDIFKLIVELLLLLLMLYLELSVCVFIELEFVGDLLELGFELCDALILLLELSVGSKELVG